LEQPARKTIALRYGHIEAALAEIMNVERENVKAFHAGLRHFRNIGVPAGLPSPGKGQAIKYTRKQALELLIALSLQKTGYGPTWAGYLAKGLNEMYQNGLAQKEGQDDMFGAVYPSIGPKEEGTSGNWTVAKDFLELANVLKVGEKIPLSPVFTVINLSHLERLLGEALDRQIYI
jgi:hypothetical protein